MSSLIAKDNLTAGGLLADILRVQAANGQFVDPMRQAPPVTAALRAIYRNVAAVRLMAWDAQEVDERKPASGASATAVNNLLKRPAPWMSRRDMIKLLVTGLVRHGECALSMRKLNGAPVGKDDQPARLHFHKKHHIQPQRSPDGRRFYYAVTDEPRNRSEDLEPHQLLHLKDPDLDDPMRGLGIDEPLLLTNKIGWYTRTYLDAFYENGATPGLVIELPGQASKKVRDQFASQWEARHGGARKSNRPAVVSGGGKVHELGQKHVDMAMPQLLKFLRDETLMVTGVPESEVALTSSSTYSNGLSGNAGFWWQILVPLMLEIEEALNDPFYGLARRYGSNLYLGFDLKSVKEVLRQADEKITALQKLVQSGVPINQAIRFLVLELDPVEGGDKPLVQSALAPLEQVLDPPEPAPPSAAPPAKEEADDEEERRRCSGAGARSRRNRIRARAVTRVRDLRDAVEREAGSVVRSLFLDMRRAQLERLDGYEARTRGVPYEDLDAALIQAGDFEDAFATEMGRVFESALMDAAETVSVEIGASLSSFNRQHPQVVQFLDVKQNRVRGIPETVRAALRESIAEGVAEAETVADLKRRVRDTMNVEGRRVEKIARTEAGEAVNGGRYMTMDIEGVESHEWSAFIDGETRSSHVDVDGEIVRVGERFSNGLLYPLEVGAPAGEVISCRCVALAVA